jgi:hypothetical protein
MRPREKIYFRPGRNKFRSRAYVTLIVGPVRPSAETAGGSRVARGPVIPGQAPSDSGVADENELDGNPGYFVAAGNARLSGLRG